MKIDFNEKECEAMEAYKRGDPVTGRKLQDEFLDEFKQFKREKGDHCSCPEECYLHGNCMLCVQVHRAHGDHLPYCMQRMVNEKLKVLSGLTEHSIVRMVRQPDYVTVQEEET